MGTNYHTATPHSSGSVSERRQRSLKGIKQLVQGLWDVNILANHTDVSLSASKGWPKQVAIFPLNP